VAKRRNSASLSPGRRASPRLRARAPHRALSAPYSSRESPSQRARGVWRLRAKAVFSPSGRKERKAKGLSLAFCRK
jgi:hypothetical protein